jgi:hypothetical protein
MANKFAGFLTNLPDLNLPESRKAERHPGYFVNLHGLTDDGHALLLQLDGWLDTAEKLSQWRAIVDTVLERVQRYEKEKSKQAARHPWPFACEADQLSLQNDEHLEAACVIVSLWHDRYAPTFSILTAEQKETIRSWPYRPCSYGAGILPQWFVHLKRYLKSQGLPSDLPKVVPQQRTETRENIKVKKKGRESVTLIEFMDRYCQLYKGIDLKSRRDALYKAAKKKTIKLPKKVRQAITGKAHFYYADDLRKKWSDLSKQVSLPSLIKP